MHRAFSAAINCGGGGRRHWEFYLRLVSSLFSPPALRDPTSLRSTIGNDGWSWWAGCFDGSVRTCLSSSPSGRAMRPSPSIVLVLPPSTLHAPSEGAFSAPTSPVSPAERAPHQRRPPLSASGPTRPALVPSILATAKHQPSPARQKNSSMWSPPRRYPKSPRPLAPAVQLPRDSIDWRSNLELDLANWAPVRGQYHELKI